MGKCLPNWPRLYFTFSMAMFFAFSSSCGRFLSGKMCNQFNIIIDTHHITSCGNWKSVLDKKLGTELPMIYMYLGSQALEKIFPLLAVKSVLNKKEVLTEICSKRLLQSCSWAWAKRDIIFHRYLLLLLIFADLKIRVPKVISQIGATCNS